MTAVLLVHCTCPETVAEHLAHTLVEESLAACVSQIGPARATFRWQGQVERASEILLLIKTTAAGYAALEHRLRELHPYEVPEIIAVPVERGLPAYLDWVAASVRARSTST
jgi:periplasmic divalent cation tolerance protein